jgi:hypothetical protein
MKTKSLLVLVFVIAFFTLGNSVSAQTHEFNLHAVCTNAWLFCFEQSNTVSGDWTYHFTYHLNKNGELEWIHWNVLNYNLVNDATGEEYIIKDTGHDSYNYFDTWQMFSNLNAMNEPYNIVYDQTDGFLTPFLPSVNPDRGTNIDGLFIKAKASGKVMGEMKTLFQLHRNSNGEITGEIEKFWMECY